MAQKTKVTAKTGSHKATGAAHKSATKATAKAVGKPSAVKAHGQAAAAKAKASGQKAGSAQGAKSSAKSAAKPAAKPLVSKIVGKGSAKSGVKSVVTGKAAAPAKVGGSNSVASAKATAATIAMKPMQSHGAAKSAKLATQKVAAKPAPTQAAVKPDAVVQNASKPSMVSGAKAAIATHAAARPTAPVRTMPAAVAKPAGQKITASVSNVTPKVIAEKTVAARQIIAAQSKPVNSRHGFKTNEFIVYPAHGVGRIVGIEEQEIAGMSLELFVITFDKEKLTLRVPTGQMQNRGMRKLSDDVVVRKALETLKGRARIKRTMWSRRAQEYVAKINSGVLSSFAEVVRDL